MTVRHQEPLQAHGVRSYSSELLRFRFYNSSGLKGTRDHEAERSDWTKREADLQVQIQSFRNALATAEREKAELETASSDSKLKPQSPQDRVVIRLPKQVVNQATGKVIFGGDSTSKTSDDEQVTEMLELGEDKVRLLLLLSNYSTTVSIDVVAGNLKMNPTLANRGLRELMDSGLVALDSIGSWGLTERGEALAVKLLTSPEPT